MDRRDKSLWMSNYRRWILLLACTSALSWRPVQAGAMTSGMIITLYKDQGVSFTSIASNDKGGYYMTATSNIVKELGADGRIAIVAGTGKTNAYGTGGYSGDGGLATQAELNEPQGVTSDGSGGFFIADTENNRIRRVNSNGIITTFAGNGTNGFSGDGGPATQASLSIPLGIAPDGKGGYYVVDNGNFRIREIDSKGIITTVAGNGMEAYFGDGGPSTQAGLYNPVSVTSDGEGGFYISDFYHSCRVRKVDANGIITTVAGNGKWEYSGDGGPATQGGVYPQGVILNGKGGYFIVDTSNCRIREVVNGIITTVAGNGKCEDNGDGGLATQAGLQYPIGAVFDDQGHLVIAQYDSASIREMFITPLSSNRPPMASDKSVSVDMDLNSDISIQATDPDGDPLSYAILQRPAHGTLSGTPPNLSYAPNKGYLGSDSFQYEAIDYYEARTATVTLSISFSRPIASDQSVSTHHDVAKPIVLSGVSKIGAPLTYSVVDPPSHGTLSGTAPDLSYAPAPGFAGSDSLTFKVNDGQDSLPATVSINVINHAPVSVSQSVSLLHDATKAITLQATDADGDAVTYAIVAQPTHGTLSGFDSSTGAVTYAPDKNYAGSDSFTFKASDGIADADATISISISNHTPIATADSYSTPEDTSLTVSAPGVLANDQDIDGDALAAVLDANPSHGSVTLNADGSFVYAPNPDYNGSDSFSYRAKDAVSSSATATVNLNIIAVNDPPVATGDSYSTREDTKLTVGAPGVLTNDHDVDGDALAAVLETGPIHGSLSLSANGSFVYAPNSNYNGPDSFTYHARDASASSATATVRITVTPVNDPPVAVADSYSTPEDATLTVAAPGVLANDQDIDGDTLAATLVTGPSHGTVTLNADGSFSYSPNPDFNGSDSFAYRASDASSSSGIATVTLTITPVNDAPVATDLSVLAFAGQATDFALSASDVDGDPLTYRIVSSPAHGLLSGTPPDLSYQPDDGFLGSDAFAFAASDGSLESAPATATIRVARPLLTLGGSLSVAAGESVVLPVAVTSDASDVAGLDLTLRATASPEAAPSLSPSFALAEATAGWSAISDPSDPWRIAIVSASGLAGPARLLLLTARAPRDAPLGATYRIEATEATLSDSKGGVSDVSGMTAPAKIAIAACEERPKGDLNHDGRASLGDAVLALRIVVLNESPENECARAAADVNCDGKIGLGDVVLILRKVALDAPFPCG